ncbi:alpha/beta hydrolase [Candidatus Bathyarchaeota archaeon]|nr:alpha/beta hydrolase [Candidatus Bathyarchaeota archaeon]
MSTTNPSSPTAVVAGYSSSGADGTRIYYEAQGQGSALLLINGWGASGLGWEHTFLEELAKSHRLIVLDNRGTGRSDKPDEEYTIHAMAEDCVAVLDTLGVEKAHVLGVSMGGLIAQELAIAYPCRVLSLVLCCTSCGLKTWTTRSKGALNRLFLRPEERLRLRMEMLFSEDFVAKEWPRLRVHWEQASRYPTPIHAYRRQWEALMDYDCCDRLSDLKAQTLIMGGDADQLNPVKRLRELADRIRGAELEIYPGLGHGFIIEARDEVVRRIRVFLRSVEEVDDWPPLAS